jgi:DnaK suppressor protein
MPSKKKRPLVMKKITKQTKKAIAKPTKKSTKKLSKKLCLAPSPKKMHVNKKNIKKIKLSGPISPKIVATLKGQNKKYYDLLMATRSHLIGQVQFLSEEALTSGAVTGEHSSGMSNHLADYGSDNFLHGMELDIMSGEMEELEMIDEALERLASGEYGRCLDCGCRIPSARLEIKPYARFCVKCKTKYEENSTKLEFDR